MRNLPIYHSGANSKSHVSLSAVTCIYNSNSFHYLKQDTALSVLKKCRKPIRGRVVPVSFQQSARFYSSIESSRDGSDGISVQEQQHSVVDSPETTEYRNRITTEIRKELERDASSRMTSRKQGRTEESDTLVSSPLSSEEWNDWIRKQYKKRHASSILQRCIEDASFSSDSISPFSLLQSLFPERNWIQDYHLPLRWFSKEELERNAHTIVNSLEKALFITDPADWNRISQRDLDLLGAHMLLKSARGRKLLLAVLHNKYPNTPWSEENLLRNRGKQSAQRWMCRQLEHLFSNDPSLRVQEEAHVPLLNEAENDPNHAPSLQVDAAVSFSNLDSNPYIIAFDYHGEHMYRDMYHQNPLEMQIERQRYKEKAMRQAGLIYVEVPFWWDRSEASLAATIVQQIETQSKHLPSITAPASQMLKNIISHLNTSHSQAHPIPIPTEYLDTQADSAPRSDKHIHSLMQPVVWRDQNISNWWISEKFDGIRATYLADTKTFLTKQGVKIPLPQNLRQQLENISVNLDGELISVAGGFHVVTSIFQRSLNQEDQWNDLRFMVFDVIPNSAMQFEERQEKLASILDEINSSFVLKVEYNRIESNAALQERLDQLRPGEEGFVLVKPHSLYTPGRAQHCIKVKQYYDQEALFVERPSESNTFIIQLTDGHKMKARVSSDLYNANGLTSNETVVTVAYSHINLSNGHPIKPMVMRLRHDMNWKQVMDNVSHGPGDDFVQQTNSSDSMSVESSDLRSILHSIGYVSNDTRFSGMSEKKQVNLLCRLLKKMRHPYLQISEHRILMEQLQVSHATLTILLRRARRKLRNPWRKTTSKELLKISSLLKQFKRDQSNPSPSKASSELYSLLERQTKLSREQIRSIIQSIRSREQFRAVTTEDRKTISALVAQQLENNSHSSQPLSREQMRHLYTQIAQQTGLHFRQLRELVRYELLSREKSQKSHQTKLLKRRLDEILNSPDSLDIPQITATLSRETGFSNDFIRKRIALQQNKMQRTSVTKEQRDLVEEICKNSSDVPSAELYSVIVERTGLPRAMARELVYNARSKQRVPITRQHKHFVEQRLAQDESTLLSSRSDAEFLSNLYRELEWNTGLNHSQIVDLVRTYKLRREKQTRFTSEHEQYIGGLLMQQESETVEKRMSNSQLYTTIQQKTNLSRDLIRTVVRSIRQRMDREKKRAPRNSAHV